MSARGVVYPASHVRTESPPSRTQSPSRGRMDTDSGADVRRRPATSSSKDQGSRYSREGEGAKMRDEVRIQIHCGENRAILSTALTTAAQSTDESRTRQEGEPRESDRILATSHPGPLRDAVEGAQYSPTRTPSGARGKEEIRRWLRDSQTSL